MASQIFSMRKTKGLKIDINVLKALLAIPNLESFYHFMDELKTLAIIPSNISEFYLAVTETKKRFRKNKFKDILSNNEDVLKVLNKYDVTSQFIVNKFDNEGKYLENHIDLLVNYLKEHSSELDAIKKLTNKIDELGLRTIYLWEDVDFTKEEFQLSGTASGTSFIYLDNIDVIPGYDTYQVKYQTTSSMYALNLCEYRGAIEPTQMIVKSLTFDSDIIPDKVDLQHCLINIKTMQNSKSSAFSDIRLAVDLEVETILTMEKLNTLERLANKVADLELQKSYLKTIKDMKDNIEKLARTNSLFEDYITKNNEDLNEECVSKEINGAIKRINLNKSLI